MRVIEAEDKIKDLQKELKDKDEGKQINLLKEVHREEIRKMEEKVKSSDNMYSWILHYKVKDQNEIKRLDKVIEDLEAKQKKLETKVEELEERVEIEQQEVMRVVDKSDEWHKRKVFELGMKEYRRITELRLKIQELENTLEVKNEQITKLSKPTKLQQFRKSVRNSVNKVREKTQRVQEKFNAYILQKNK